MKKRSLVLLICFSFLIGGFAGSYADSLKKEIVALEDASIRVLMNGKALNLRSSEGKVLSPILYNDSTYLPVRTIAESLKIAVNWDDETRQVLLGELLDYIPVDNDSLFDRGNFTIFTKNVEMLYTPEKSYKYGYIRQEANYYTHDILMLDGKYTKFTVDMCNLTKYNEDTRVIFTDVDTTEILKEIIIKPNETYPLDLNVSGVKKLQIQVTGPSRVYNIGGDSLLYGEPKLK